MWGGPVRARSQWRPQRKAPCCNWESQWSRREECSSLCSLERPAVAETLERPAVPSLSVSSTCLPCDLVPAGDQGSSRAHRRAQIEEFIRSLGPLAQDRRESLRITWWHQARSTS